MSADLLAEFDSFYQAPQSGKSQTTSSPAINDLSLLGSTSQGTEGGNGERLWQAPAPGQNEDVWGNLIAPRNARQPEKAQDDIWGSFQSMEEEGKPPAPKSVAPMTNYGARGGMLPAKDKPNMIRRDTLQMFSSSVDGWGSSGVNPANAIVQMANAVKPAAPARQSSSGNDILFDAENMSEEDDDFGDFEEAPSEPASSYTQFSQVEKTQPVNPKSLGDLLGSVSIQPQPPPKPVKRPVDLSPISAGGNVIYPQGPKSPSFQERNPFANLGVATSQASKIKKSETREASPVTPWPTFESTKPAPYQDSPLPDTALDGDWGDFSDMPPDIPVLKLGKPPTSGIEADAWGWDMADGVSPRKPTPTSEPKKDIPPPTNIPPPSVLIPVLNSLFDLPQSTLFKPVANQPFSLKNRILSDPTTIDFLRSYLLIANVAAHIIAGRKLRWKRDTLLSQAMKIGPAAAGGKGGMKLTGIDKAEITREDREASDLVRIWKDQLGRLKSAVAVANTSIQDVSTHLRIPEIGETMQVKVQEGEMTAPKQCLICGLKREERVLKVDVQVEDSFGEWWVEHWGHRACRNFWLEHEGKLRHR